jgi:hypothetical protein
MKVSEKRFLREIRGNKREKLTGMWRKEHTDELHDLRL